MRATLVALAVALLATTYAAGAQSPTAPLAAQALTGHGGPVRAMTVLADGTLVTGGFDSAIVVWNAARGTARRVLRFHEGAVVALVALKGDCFASGGEDARISLWCGDTPSPTRVLIGHTAPVASFAVSPDGRTLASTSWDGQSRMWRLEGTAPPRVIDGHKGPVHSVAFLADGSAIVTVGYDGQVRVTFLDPGRAALSRSSPTPLNAVVTTRDGRILVAGADGRVRVLGPDLNLLRELALDQGPLTALALSADETLLVTAGPRTPVTLIDRPLASDGLRVRSQILGPSLPVWALAFADEKGLELFTGGADRAVRRWNTATAQASGATVMPATEPDTATDSSRRAAEPGERIFRACRACHGLDPADTNMAGPTLHGLFGRRIATAPGYAYSPALKAMDIVWTPETVSRLFEIGPNAYTPGTKMPEQRLTDPDDRRALVDWLAARTMPSRP